MGEFEIANTLYKASVLLEDIQRPLDSDLEISTNRKKPKKFLKKIVSLAQIIKTMGDSGKAMMQIGSSIRTFSKIKPTASLTQGLNIGAIAFAALDFFLIPFIYLTAYLLDGKAPVNRSNNARWLFSAIVLGLTITSICVPAIAVAIAFTTASISLTLSLFLLGQALHECYHLSKERRATRKLIAGAQSQIEKSQNKASRLRAALDDASTEQQLQLHYAQIISLQEIFNPQKEYLIKLKLKESKLDKKIKNVGLVQVMDKGVGLSLCTMAMSGLIVSLYFPVAGLGILTAVSAISLTYLLLRLALPLLQLLGRWMMSKLGPGAGEHNSKDDPGQKYEHNKEPSTDLMIEHFFGSKKNATEFLKRIPRKDEDLSLKSTSTIFQTEKSSLKRRDKKELICSELII
ncbi:hypothetical protein [Legionella parisiensis]|uniref:Coiled-coil protein n=1 Tax=Legionella parisiensis TaxID=45071 RepID=A0A1E5JMA5_9GAMM|nr:hypothetical protein [Legionella parisiensis]KTD42602.1 coiled-coil protein [Legionella parisiensis]OEH45675.1 hypothetical protein lpari_03403 [Legionella parisiensis]STX71720.1 coiled-coil protein [Legionella parisiensis]